jgi:hypothetical protein
MGNKDVFVFNLVSILLIYPQDVLFTQQPNQRSISMRLMKHFSYLLFSLLLVACGGESIGDSPDTGTETNVYTIALSMSSTEVSADNPAIVTATVTLNAVPVQGIIVLFKCERCHTDPALGNALTDENGLAVITIRAGTETGADTVVASLETGESTTKGYNNAGDGIPPGKTITLTAPDEISHASPGTLTAVVMLANLGVASPVVGELVTFTTNLGVLDPVNGAAITNTAGIATITLKAGNVAGPGVATASNSTNSDLSTATVTFTSLGDSAPQGKLITLSAPSETITHASPGVLTAIVTENGEALAGEIVTFSANLGLLDPLSGIAVTDASGTASVVIKAGTVTGTGIAQVTVASADTASAVLSTAGDSPVPSKTITLTVPANISNASPGILTATVIENGSPVAGEIVTFSTTLGLLQPTSGLASTNSNGIATLVLNAGGTAGTGLVTVTSSTSESDSKIFATTGDGSTSPISFTLALIDQQGNPTSNVSGANPATLRAVMLNNNEASAGILVTFSLASDIGLLNPTSGTTLTDSNGIASLILQAGANPGASTVTATVEGGITASINFSVSISATDVAMTTAQITPASIGANGTATVEISITETTNGVTSPLSETAVVQFTSECVQSGTASLDTDVETIAGVAKSTYKDQGCGITDTINISAAVGQSILTQSGTIDVQAASAGSIEFISASPANIALRGTGGSGRSETSTVTFRVIDSIGHPVQNIGVNFGLTIAVGGLTISPDTGVEGPAQTDSNGNVDVIVQSGTVPTPVRVVATLDSDISISTVSDELVISTGVADFNSLSLSASTLNTEGWALDGTQSTITARASDHFNNPVPDGTAVFFTTEFGSIEDSCTTVNGNCSVLWTSSAPRTPLPVFRDPAAITRQLGDITVGECKHADGSDTDLNGASLPCFYSNSTTATTTEAAFYGGLGSVYGNRVSIRATILGEESFTDSNANGQFDQGEAFTDLSEAFTDDNEDGIFDGKLDDGTPAAGASDVDGKCYGVDSSLECYQTGGDNEEFVDFNSNQIFDLANGKYNGVLCPVESEAANICSRDLLTIWSNITVLQSGSTANIGLIVSGADPFVSANYFQPLTLPATVNAHVADLHNGLMPAGTSIVFTAGNGEIVGPSSCTVANSSAFSINSCAVALIEDESPSTGVLVVTVTTPAGLQTTRSITVSD